MDKKYQLPEIVKGYEVFEGLISFVRPAEYAVNLIENPKMWETTGYVGHTGETSEIQYSHSDQYRGIFSLYCEAESPYLQTIVGHSVDLIANEKYKFGADLKLKANQTIYIYLCSGTNEAPDDAVLIKTIPSGSTGRWQRVNWEFDAPSTATYTLYIATGLDGYDNLIPFYTDGWLLINTNDVSGENEIYFDGDTQSFSTSNDFSWFGARNSSTSIRNAGAGASGREVFLSDIGLKINGVAGLGMNPVRNIATALHTGGGYYHNTVPDVRQIALVGKIMAENRADYMAMRRDLIDYFKPDRAPTKSPMLMRIYNFDASGDIITPVLELKVVYQGGLEGAYASDFGEEIALNFIQYDQFITEDKENAEEAIRVATDSEGFELLRSTGDIDIVSSLEDDDFSVYSIRDILISEDGDIFIAGQIDDTGATSYRHIARYDGSNWNPINDGSNGFGNSINDIVHAISEAGDSVLFGGETSGNPIIVYSKENDIFSTPSEQPTGTVYALENKDGMFYVGGNFTKYLITYSGTVGFKEVQPAGDIVESWRVGCIDSDGSHMLAGIFSGRLYLSTDYGSTWTEVQPAGDVNKYWEVGRIDSDGSHMLLAEYHNRLRLSTDSGSTWTEPQPKGDIDGNWRALAMDSDGSHMLAGESAGRLYLSTNSGSTWTEAQPAGDVGKSWYALAMDSDGSHMLAGAYDARLYLSTDSGSTWSEVQPAGDVTRQWKTASMNSDGTYMLAGAYLGLYNGRLYLSTDSGSTWSEIDPSDGDESKWYALAIDSDGSHMLAGTHNGRLFLSTDYGSTWTEVQPAGDIDRYWYAVSIDSDGSHMLAGVSPGRLYVSTDGSPWGDIGISNNVVRCLLLSKDESKLFVGGDFTEIDSTSCNRIAYYDFDTEDWVAMGDGLDGSVYDIVEAEDGTVYACGSFTTIQSGSVQATFVARFRWQDDDWTAITGETNWHNYAFGPISRLNAMTITNKGVLYLGAQALISTTEFQKPSLYKYANNNSVVPTHNLTGPVYTLENEAGGGLYVGSSNLDESDNLLFSRQTFYVTPEIENATSYPEIHLRGPGKLYAVENHTTSQGLYFKELELEYGDHLIIRIDPAIGVTFAGLPNISRYFLSGSDLSFSLTPGENIVSVSFYSEFEHYSGDTAYGSSFVANELNAENTNNGNKITLEITYPCPINGAGYTQAELKGYDDTVLAKGSLASPYGEFVALAEVGDSGVTGSVYIGDDETSYSILYHVGLVSLVWKNRRWSIDEDLD